MKRRPGTTTSRDDRVKGCIRLRTWMSHPVQLRRALRHLERQWAGVAAGGRGNVSVLGVGGGRARWPRRHGMARQLLERPVVVRPRIGGA
jgi:hypothetical protein